MREFIQEFEHSTHRMYQMLHGTLADPDDDKAARDIMTLFDWVYRLSTYALVSAWIDDKQEDYSISIRYNLTTGEVREESRLTKMRVPKKYWKSTRKL